MADWWNQDFIGPVNPNASAPGAYPGSPVYTGAQPGPWAGGYVFPNEPAPGTPVYGDYYVSAPNSPPPAGTPVLPADIPQYAPPNAARSGAWNDPWVNQGGMYSPPLTPPDGRGMSGWNDPWGNQMQQAPPLTPPDGRGINTPDWMAPADTWLGKTERNVARPNQNIFERGGALLGGLMEGLGIGAQLAEGVLGEAFSTVPRNVASGFVSGQQGQSFAQEAQLQADTLKTAQPNYASPYLQKTRDELLKDPVGAVMANPNSDAEVAMWAVKNIAYTGATGNPQRGGANPQVGAVARVLAGEAPDVAMNGAEKPDPKNAYGDELQLWQTRVDEYVNAAGRRANAKAHDMYAIDPAGSTLPNGQRMTLDEYTRAKAEQAQAEAARLVNATGRIPGEANPIAEMVGQMVLDPLNLITGPEKAVAKLDDAADAARVVDEAYKMTKGVSPVSGIGARIMDAAEKGNPVAQALDKIGSKVFDLAAYTPATESRIRTGVSFKQIGALTLDADNVDEAVDLLRRFARDPEGLVDSFGKVVVGVEASAARPVIAGAMPRIERIAAEMKKAGQVFDPVEFLGKVTPELEKAANAVSGYNPDAALPAWQKVTQTLKSWMSEFYLKTPGYVVRNFVSDNMIATMDGLRMYEKMPQVMSDLDKFGATTRRMAQGTGTLIEDIGMGSKLANVPIIGGIQTKIGQVADSAEKSRYTRAFHSALMDAWSTNWRPTLGENTRALFDGVGLNDVADELEKALRNGKSGKDLRRILEEFYQAEHPAQRFHVTQFVERADDLPAEMAAKIEKGARDIATRGGTADDVAKLVDDEIKAVRADAASKFANLGETLTPRANVKGDAVQDIEELQREMEAMLARAVNHGEITREDALQLMADELAQHKAQLQELHTAREELASVFRANADAPHAVDVIEHVTGFEMRRREDARMALDPLRRKIMQSDDARYSASAWQTYRNERNATWSAQHGDVVAEYGKAKNALAELKTGTRPAEDVLNAYGVKTSEQRAGDLLEAIRGRLTADTRTAGQVFDTGINEYRAAFDTAQTELARQAGRTIEANPQLAQDALDVLWSVKGDADRRFEQVIGKQYDLLGKKAEGKITFEQYTQAMGEEWKAAWEFVLERYRNYGAQQLRGVELRNAFYAKDLRGLGYGGDELARLVGGIGDGTTREEVSRILAERRVAARPITNYQLPITNDAAGFDFLKPPQSADELMAGGASADEALANAKRMRDQAEGLVMASDTRGVAKEATRTAIPKDVVSKWLKPDGTPKTQGGVAWTDRPFGRVDSVAESYGYQNLDEFAQALRDVKGGLKQSGVRGLGLGAGQVDAAAAAAEKWDGLIADLQQRAHFASGMSEQASAARQMVGEVIKEQGMADGVDTMRQLAEASDPEIGKAISEEIRAAVTARAEREMDNGASWNGIKQTLADAALNKNDVGERANAIANYAMKNNIPLVRGMEDATDVELARAFGKELGVAADEWTRGERSASEIIAAARKKNKTLADAILNADTVNADGRIKAADWAQLVAEHGVTGERRTPGVMLKELAGEKTGARGLGLGAGDTGATVALRGWGGGMKGETRPDTLASVGDQVRNGFGFGRIETITPDGIKLRGDPKLYQADELQFVEAARGATRERAGMGATHPQPLPTGGGSAAQEAERLAARDGIVELHGRAEPPSVEDSLRAVERTQLAALQKIRDGLVAGWDATVTPLPKNARVALEQDMQRLAQELNEVRYASITNAEQRADFALLDYSKKRGIDTYVSAVAPYAYWGTRQGRNFAIRIAERPALLAQYLRYKDGMRRENQRRGYRQRFEGGWEIPVGNGNSVFIDPTAMIFPFANMVNFREGDAENNRGILAQIYTAADGLGFRAAPWIDLPTRYLNLLVTAQPGTPEYEQQAGELGRGSIGSLVPQTGLIKGLTAAAGVGGVGGMDIERPIRAALGLNEAGRFEAYGVARAVRDLAVERGAQNTQPYLLAQAFIAGRDEKGWGELLNTLTPDALAREYGVSGADAAAALQVVRDAATKAGQQGAIGSIASTLGGMSVKAMPAGERGFLGMQRAEKAAAYNATTGVGSRDEMLQVRQRYPALGVARAQYGTIPGESETQPLQLYRSSVREEINAKFDALKDATIRNAPWDKAAANRVEDARQKALATVQPAAAQTWQDIYAQTAGLPTPSPSAQTSLQEEGYRPRSVAGANPAEKAKIRKDEMLAALAATAPKYEAFKDSNGNGDYEAYQRARTTWLADLQRQARNNPTVNEVVKQAYRDGVGEVVAGAARGLGAADMQRYWQRNDSPMEAVQKAYYEVIYNPTMQIYYDARDKQGLTGAKLQAVYDNAIRKTQATTPDQLTAAVARVYGNRWSAGELGTMLGGMQMPSVFEVNRANMTPSARQSAERTDAQKAEKARQAAVYTAHYNAQVAEFNKTVSGAYGAGALQLWEQYRKSDTSTKQKMARNGTIKAIISYRSKFGAANAEFKKSYK